MLFISQFYFPSDDDTGGNPMVAGFQDDLDSDDDLRTPATSKNAAFHANPAVKGDVDISSEEEEEEEKDKFSNPHVKALEVDLSSDEDLSRTNPAVSIATVSITDSEEEAEPRESQVRESVRKNSDRSAEEKKKKDSKKEKEDKVVHTETRQSQSSSVGVRPAKTKPVVVDSEEGESSSVGGDNAEGRGDNSATGAEEGEGSTGKADKNFHIDVPKEDFGNWLDQFEVKVGWFSTDS